MIARLQMSDLHLGDPRSILSNPDIAKKVVYQVARLSGGHVGTLFVDGDGWEECVPGNIHSMLDGIATSVAHASEAFFGELFRTVKVDKVVVVPGNHDLSTWHWYALQNNLSPVTPYEGVQVTPTVWPWRHLLPGCPDNLTFAYPMYWDKSAGEDYPTLFVTHGHLLDSLVLGEDPQVTYDALKALGCARPSVRPDGSVRALAQDTLQFCLALWSRYSERDALFFNKIMRRLEYPESCIFQKMFVSAGYYRFDEPMCLSDQASPGHSANLPSFLDRIIMDPYLPTPVGSLRQGSVGPAFEKPSCLTFGHDHLAIRKTIIASGVPFVAADSGGWTSEYEGHLPHSHVLVWPEVTDVVPTSYLIRVRTNEGKVL